MKKEIPFPNFDEKEIRLAYDSHEKNRILQIGTIGALLGVIMPILFGFQDYYIIEKPEYLPARLFSFIPSLLFLILRFTLFKYSLKYIRIFLYLMLFGFMLTSGYKLVLYQWGYFIIQGMIYIILAVFFVYIGKPLPLLIIYFLPFSFIVLFEFFFKDLTIKNFSMMSNPLALMIGGVFLSKIFYTLRYNEFKANHILLQKNDEYIHELEMAERIQYKLIPNQLPDYKDIKIQSIYHPMRKIGGDFYDYIEFSDSSKLGIFISDVMGHGVPAALHTGIIKSLISNAETNILNDPGLLLSYINNNMTNITNGTILTAFYCIFDIKKMEMTYAGGGHCPPLLLRGTSIQELISTGTILGFMTDLLYQNTTITLKEQDKIIFYTDGLTETRRYDETYFQNTLMSDIIPELTNYNISNVVTSIFKQLINFRGSDEFDDDVCIVGVEII